ncbi:MAG: glycosyltransferase family 2 protein [Alistipes sp.]
MTTVTIIFWIAAGVVFYTYLGYGLLLFVLVKIKEWFSPPRHRELPDVLPAVTLLIAAYNEEAVVKAKMENCRSLRYPNLHIVWITDGSTDRTNTLLAEYADVQILFEAKRGGKTAALNRSIDFLTTPLVVYTDANTMLNADAIREIVRQFQDPAVGCVAGEKRVLDKENATATATEGIYWKYESKLKEWDFRLYSAVGAAGELFAVRRDLYRKLPNDTLLDDFVLSMQIAGQGYKIAYCKQAYAMETPSADMVEEGKRKARIAAGGLQSIGRLLPLLNPFRYGVLAFQYFSHRVLRWSLTPVLLAALLPLNIALVAGGAEHTPLYTLLLLLQGVFYVAGFTGAWLARRGIKSKVLFVPYYFLFMNLNVFKGVGYLVKNNGQGAWEKAKRA